ncbi:MAG TPA: MBL fold hydrolase [Firmicutes bacterium]|nr:MBL fold hydrolase [Bacillota bacterium]
MAVREITKGIYAVGALDWERRLFDELIPLPYGTSYNAYLVKGSEKTVLLDTVDPTKGQELRDHLRALNVDKIDYIVAHHGEQDHSGTIPQILELYPEALVLTNEKCSVILQDLLHIPAAKLRVVQEEETISLGEKTLKFIFTPWVHWPETMVTYLPEDKILFSCDFFSSHLATGELFASNQSNTYSAAKRFFSEIMMPFRAAIRNNLKRLENLEIKMIAPSHGPVYDNPAIILEAYREWSDEAGVKNEAVIIYVSMHGSTEKMVRVLTDALFKRGVGVKPFRLTVTDTGELAVALVDAATLVVASPAVLGGAHPQVAYAAMLAAALRPRVKFGAIIGSYGWGSKMVEQLGGLIGGLKAELLEPVVAKGYPREEHLAALDTLAARIDQSHKDLGIQ